MLLEEMLKDERKEGRKEGREEGRKEIMAKMNRLIQLLMEQQRLDDLVHATEDEAFQKKLFDEFGL